MECNEWNRERQRSEWNEMKWNRERQRSECNEMNGIASGSVAEWNARAVASRNVMGVK